MKSQRRVYSIGQLASSTGCKSVTIRYYEKQGLLSEPSRTASGYRVYGEADRERLVFLRRCRELGFALKEIRELLSIADHRQASCRAVTVSMTRHLEDVRQRIRDLRALEAEMQRLLRSCQGGSVAQCRILEALSGGRAG